MMMTDTVAGEIERTSNVNYDEWDFGYEVVVRMNNSAGEDVVATKKYRHGPKRDDLTADPDAVHEYIEYWWTDEDTYPKSGVLPFHDSDAVWVASTTGVDELQAECRQRALLDVQAEAEGLAAVDESIAERLDLERLQD